MKRLKMLDPKCFKQAPDDGRLIPEIKTAIDHEFTYTESKGNRPRIAYNYDDGTDPIGDEGLLHGELTKLRLKDFSLPDFLGLGLPRQGFEYDQQTGRVSAVLLPTSVNPEEEAPTLTVRWDYEYPDPPEAVAEPTVVLIKAPVGDDGERHLIEYRFDHGRVVMKTEQLPVHDPETR